MKEQIQQILEALASNSYANTMDNNSGDLC